jgi:hypothetical protein
VIIELWAEWPQWATAVGLGKIFDEVSAYCREGRCCYRPEIHRRQGRQLSFSAEGMATVAGCAETPHSTTWDIPYRLSHCLSSASCESHASCILGNTESTLLPVGAIGVQQACWVCMTAGHSGQNNAVQQSARANNSRVEWLLSSRPAGCILALCTRMGRTAERWELRT